MLCEAGKAGETPGVSAILDCNTHVHVIKYAAIGASVCSSCATGYWSAVVGSFTSSNCVLCETGDASLVPGTTSANTCTPCPVERAASLRAGALLCDGDVNAERAALVAVLRNVLGWRGSWEGYLGGGWEVRVDRKAFLVWWRIRRGRIIFVI